MSYSVAFSPEALAQLDALEDYIGHTGSPLAAARLVDNIIGYCESLALFPQRGNRRDDVLPHLRITHYRHTTAIAFRVEPDIQKSRSSVCFTVGKIIRRCYPMTRNNPVHSVLYKQGRQQ